MIDSHKTFCSSSVDQITLNPIKDKNESKSSLIKCVFLLKYSFIFDFTLSFLEGDFVFKVLFILVLFDVFFLELKLFSGFSSNISDLVFKERNENSSLIF